MTKSGSYLEKCQVAADAVLDGNYEAARAAVADLDCGDEWIGQKITFYCAVYIYTGVLVAIEPQSYFLRDCVIVYNTGDHDSDEVSDSGTMSSKLNPDGLRRIRKAAVESWGPYK